MRKAPAKAALFCNGYIRLADLARLDIVALILRVTHGEGLAGQHAVGHDGLEELLLAHRGKQEAHVALLGAELAGDLIAVDVVHLTAELLEVLVDERLQRADGQLHLRDRER